MATIAKTHAPLGAVNNLHGAGFFTQVLTNILRWNDERNTRKALSALTDAQLDDIGLSREDVAKF
ncbi:MULTISPECIES: DUF1127 domain-containing protein [unclassified Ruegeria]|uniref:DUF1127 domain-containing protein n=1 Tax=unclassified Ruegeria TaxID=2625375 RepID=UPI0014883EE9|nr:MULTISPECIES: DUF1127 domain-containing protein [unclassified Ruegeria]